MHIAAIVAVDVNANKSLLSWSLDGYLRQSLNPGHSLEILVGIDGENCASDAIMTTTMPNGLSHTTFPSLGLAGVRQKLVEMTSDETELIIFSGGDAQPFPTMVQRHADAMGRLPAESIVVGASPWERPQQPPQTVFDAFVAETPAVYPYASMKPESFHDFRHVNGLNYSIRRRDFFKAGGFQSGLRPSCYEDVDLAYRLLGARAGVWFDTNACVLHRRPLALDQYLDGEEYLGMMMVVLEKKSPDVFALLNGTKDLPHLAAAFKVWVTMDKTLHQATYRKMEEWGPLPKASLGGAVAKQRTLGMIYHIHIPLKRLAFRLGFLRGLDMTDDSLWQSRTPQGLWRKVVFS